MTVRVVDAEGRGVPDTSVSFIVVEGDASYAGDRAQSTFSDALGLAHTNALLGKGAGTVKIEARLFDVNGAVTSRVTFTATATR